MKVLEVTSQLKVKMEAKLFDDLAYKLLMFVIIVQDRCTAIRLVTFLLPVFK